MQDQIYKDNILEHWQNPQNFGTIPNPDIISEENNPFCGDHIHLTIKLKNNKIHEIAFNGNGCAISMATASMLTENIKNKSITNLKKMKDTDVLKLLGINLTPTRTKCALLIYTTLQKGLNKT